MSTIAVIGATGYAGGHIVDEAHRRGHHVIGVARNTSQEAAPGIEVRRGDISDQEFVRQLARDADVIVVATHGASEGRAFLAPLVPGLLGAAREGGARLGFVGGAGSLQVSSGGPLLIDTPEFPEIYKFEARSHQAVLEALRTSGSDADWFYVSPSAAFGSYNPGERTGSYRTDDDVLVSDDSGNSFISGADFALAILDEIDQPAHVRQRFTVGY